MSAGPRALGAGWPRQSRAGLRPRALGRVSGGANARFARPRWLSRSRALARNRSASHGCSPSLRSERDGSLGRAATVPARIGGTGTGCHRRCTRAGRGARGSSRGGSGKERRRWVEVDVHGGGVNKQPPRRARRMASSDTYDLIVNATQRNAFRRGSESAEGDPQR
jgi:hypothetical protein